MDVPHQACEGWISLQPAAASQNVQVNVDLKELDPFSLHSSPKTSPKTSPKAGNFWLRFLQWSLQWCWWSMFTLYTQIEDTVLLKKTSLYVLPPVILATAILPNKCDQKNSKDIKRVILTKRTQISTDTENCPAIPADKVPTCGEQHQKLHEHART